MFQIRRLPLLYVALLVIAFMATAFTINSVHAAHVIPMESDEDAVTNVSQSTFPELPMTPDGGLGEMHVDGEGHLWVSEYDASVIWQIDPTGNTRTQYTGLSGGVVEAQMGPDGAVWFGGYDNGSLARMDLSSSTVTTWTLPGAMRPWGMAFDPGGDLWISEHDVARLYRYSPGSNQFCTYNLPDETKSIYLRADSQGIWLADYINNRMARINSATNQLTGWPIQPQGNANPYEMVIDSRGHLWWGDGGMAALAVLDPTTNRITLYTRSTLSSSTLIALADDGPMGPETVWFTDSFTQRIGAFKPGQARANSYTVSPTTTALSSTCETLGAGSNAAVTVQSQALSFGQASVPAADLGICGWLLQDMPTDSQLYDIAVVNGEVWYVDFGRDRLGRLPSGYADQMAETCHYLHLPGVKK